MVRDRSCSRRLYYSLISIYPVLSANKPKAPAGKKGSKEHEEALWEAELREALARKKPVAAQLSKQDRQALEQQLAKETEIRARMAAALGRLQRGFALVLCLVNSKAELVKEYLASMVRDLLQIVVTRPASLVSDDAFATMQVCRFYGIESVRSLTSEIRSRPLAMYAQSDLDTQRSLLASLYSAVSTRQSYLSSSSPSLWPLSSRVFSSAFTSLLSKRRSTPERTRTLRHWSARFCDPGASA